MPRIFPIPGLEVGFNKEEMVRILLNHVGFLTIGEVARYSTAKFDGEELIITILKKPDVRG